MATPSSSPTAAERRLNLLWLALVGLTLGGTLLVERANPGVAVTLFICLTMAIKGRLIIDYFMELKAFPGRLQRLFRLYFYLLPLLTLCTWLFADQIAAMTTLITR
ncbi:MAG: cytochrome C oxidase subunit IV family protein [Gammaproteobacteria bacterium]|nr:cytochrome C oxidase subunit IV family protein [Gammaproteobacteria bacterium]